MPENNPFSGGSGRESFSQHSATNPEQLFALANGQEESFPVLKAFQDFLEQERAVMEVRAPAKAQPETDAFEENKKFLLAQDAARMAQVPGVGRKKASRLLVELSDVFSKNAELRGLVGLSGPDAGLPLSASPVSAGVEAEAAEALLSMGFTSQEAELALEGHEEAGAVTIEQVLAYALRRLGSGR